MTHLINLSIIMFLGFGHKLSISAYRWSHGLDWKSFLTVVITYHLLHYNERNHDFTWLHREWHKKINKYTLLVQFQLGLVYYMLFWSQLKLWFCVKHKIQKENRKSVVFFFSSSPSPLTDLVWHRQLNLFELLCVYSVALTYLHGISVWNACLVRL